ncbi:MAG: FtsX-like permease family protein [Bacteroidetes bacterium]|nr:MAG: FtsX-like permease family protein [Bacteroidota bacterium]
MEDFDKQIMLCDIRHIQQLNDWGIQSSIRVLDTLVDQYLVIKGIVSGGNGNYRYDWGKGYEAYPAFTWYPEKDTVFRLIASDYWMFINGKNEQTTIPDTAYLKVHINSSTEHNFPIQCQADGTIRREYLNESGTKFRLFAKDRTIDFEMIDGQGSHQNYIGAYEFNFHSWDHFDEHLAELKSLVNFNYSSEHQDIRVSGIKEQQQEIFIWLGFLDINVWIIISLMLLIGIINMGSAMLVLILLRTPVIGLLKAMGSNNWSVRKVFLYQVAFLILKGMFWGNLIGLGLCLIQDYFQVIKLNPAVYYLNAAPIELNWISILLINLLTIFICLIAMLIPSLVISRIHPAKSIKFN